MSENWKQICDIKTGNGIKDLKFEFGRARPIICNLLILTDTDYKYGLFIASAKFSLIQIPKSICMVHLSKRTEQGS